MRLRQIFGWHLAIWHKLAFCSVGNRTRMLTLCVKFLLGKLWITELCDVDLSELRGGHSQTYLDFVRVSPVLFEDTLHRHVTREDHYIIVLLSAHQLTLISCVCERESEKKRERETVKVQYEPNMPS